MADYLFNSPDDYHYDNSGHYPYIVFNGDDQTLISLQQALQSQGFGYYSHGESFRPADDGRQYYWYIRLHGRGDEKPVTKAVDDFLRQFLKPRQPAPQPSANEKLMKDLFQEAFAHYEQSIEELKQGFNELRSDIQANSAAQVELGDILEQGVANHAALEETRQELERTKEELEEVEHKHAGAVIRAENLERELTHSASGGLNDELDRVEKAKRKVERDRDKFKQENRNLRKSFQEAKRDNENWKSRFTEVSEEIGRLQDELEQIREGDPKVIPVSKPDFDLETVIDAILPELRLVEESWDHLKFGELNHGAVLRRLRSIVRDEQVPGSKAVVGADNWMEVHVDRRLWRIYFCRKNSLVGDKIVAMIGKKGNQTSGDMQRLRANPPESYL